MTTTMGWGEDVTVLMELGFPVKEFTLADYATTTTRTNLVPNPSFETNTTGWAVSGAAGSVARSTTYSYVGTSSAERSVTGTGTANIQSSTIAVTAGATYIGSGYVRSTVARSSRLVINWYTAALGFISQSIGTSVTSTTTGFTRVSASGTAPATAAFATPFFQNLSVAAGESHYWDAMLFESGATLLPYFDGTVADPYTGYTLTAQAWNGTTNNSTSTATWGLNSSLGGSTLDGDFYLDGTLEGLDVSPYCRELTINRGRPDQLQNFTAGTCSISLLNRDRRFDPLNEDSPYWDAVQGRSGVTPRRKVTIKSGGVPIFTGRITDIDISYEPTRPGASEENSMATITASDDFVLLANTATDSDITPTEQYSGARVEAILDLPEVSFPNTRSIETGTAVLGGGATFLIPTGQNILEYLQQVALAEQGYFFVAANGDLTFTDRLTAGFAVVAANFSDTGTDIPYSGLDVIYGQEFLYNKIVCQIVAGTAQVADNAASQTEFGISTLSLTDLLLSTDAAALTLAQELLDKYEMPEYRFDRLRTIYNMLDAGDRTTVTGLEIGDIIEITRSYATGTPASVTKAYSIEGVQHRITSSSHEVEFALASTVILSEFILDDAVFGVLDSTNALA